MSNQANLNLRELDWWIFENVTVGKGTRACILNCPLYSSSPAALEVLKKCVARSEGYQIQLDDNTVTWGKNGMSSHADTLEKAICLFAKSLFEYES